MTKGRATVEDEEVMEAMRAVDSAMGTGGAESAGAGAEAIPNPCDAYNKIRKVLPTLIKIAERIPVIGPRIAAALKLLKSIGDRFCPA